MFAARADILPEPYLGAIGTLTDQVPPLPTAWPSAVVREELGATSGELFERFDARAARRGLARPGAPGLVPGPRGGGQGPPARRRGHWCGEDLDVSFRILFLLNLLFPNHHTRAITAIVSEFVASGSADELDFREEARNAATLRRNFAGRAARRRAGGRDRADAGAACWCWSTWRAPGSTGCTSASPPASSTSTRLIETVVDAYIKMMLEDGVFHADPHAGNLLVDPQGRLVLLDFGMVLQVERETRRRLVETVLAAARQDVDGVINGFYELGHPRSRRGSRHRARRGAEPDGRLAAGRRRRPGRSSGWSSRCSRRSTSGR